LADDAAFMAEKLNNFLWAAFTRCNPSHDIYGVNSFTHHKHWGCKGPLILDARKKPHHAPVLEKDSACLKKIQLPKRRLINYLRRVVVCMVK